MFVFMCEGSMKAIQQLIEFLGHPSKTSMIRLAQSCQAKSQSLSNAPVLVPEKTTGSQQLTLIVVIV